MEKFNYKYFFNKIEVGVSKECIEYRKHTIPTNEIQGFGIQLIQTGKAVGNQFGIVGALAANAMTKNKYADFEQAEPNKTAPFEAIPDKTAMLVVAYKPMGAAPDQGNKALNIPINKDDQECIRMLNTLKSNMPDKYVGIGVQGHIQKALNISMKKELIAAGIIVGIIVAVIVAIAILSATTNSHL